MNSSEMLFYLRTQFLGDHARGALPDAPVILEDAPRKATGRRTITAMRARTATFLHAAAWWIEPNALDVVEDPSCATRLQ